jgi:mono/diheme cytochrome c family protein
MQASLKKSLQLLLFSVAATAIASPALAQTTGATTPATTPTPALQYAKQGWSVEDRQTFYTTSQGSHMIPYLWFKALRRLDADEPFGGDQLARYGYLANEKSKANPEGLPVGFVLDGDARTGFFGMTCAACHTAQIEYQKDGASQQLRIDGAPATADFQAFLKDLTEAAKATLNDAGRYDKFARAVLGNRYSVTRANDLKTDFAAWVKQWTNFMDKSLPASPWGPGRLDAFGMIFNRVAAKDLAIDANFKVADAPVSYPFLWNASRQDKTQWNGGVPNGLYINALGRNSGEVFGVFAEFTPKKLTDTHPPLIDYSKSSIKYAGLQALEEKIKMLTPPPWPWASEIKQDMVDKGRVLYAKECGGCHEEKRLPLGTWLTPVMDVGTDQKMFDNAERTSQAGILAGALSPNPPGSTLADPAATNDVLATVVVGALINEAFSFPPRFPNGGVWRAIREDLQDLYSDKEKAPNLISLLDPSVREDLKSHVVSRLAQMFKVPGPPHAYESRVLHGIWATAPYLHNGSVPNLWELLTPPEQRKPFFMVGSKKYDAKNVGYVTDESPFKDGKLVVSGSDVQPGNGNSGHEFGTKLSDDEKWQLIEYLKQL